MAILQISKKGAESRSNTFTCGPSDWERWVLPTPGKPAITRAAIADSKTIRPWRERCRLFILQLSLVLQISSYLGSGDLSLCATYAPVFTQCIGLLYERGIRLPLYFAWTPLVSLNPPHVLRKVGERVTSSHAGLRLWRSTIASAASDFAGSGYQFCAC